MNALTVPYPDVGFGMELAGTTAYDERILVFIRRHPVRAGAFRAFKHGR
ncbi:hypothetical protein [uncultured Stenotrophomonas sp.]|jgi:hypothetical protein|nr:hypothetical protein [uncultured Stenotrophomonas sp.]